MRNLIIVITCFCLSTQFTFSQNILSSVDGLKKQVFTPEIQKIMSQASEMMESLRFCQTAYEWDSLTGEFVYAGESVMEINLDGEIKTLVIDVITLDDGEETNLRLISYWTFQEILFNEDLNVDSTLIFFGDGMGNYELFSRTINHFENEILMLTEEYFDYSLFGFPLGMTLSEITRYHYDNNDFLVDKVTDAFDFGTFSMIFSDSTVYFNNTAGLVQKEISYSPDFLSGDITADYQMEYTYGSSKYPMEELISYFEGGNWVKSDRNTFSYDNMDRPLTQLAEYTVDDGLSWDLYERTQFDYQSNFPYGFYDSEVTQVYQSDGWVNLSLNTFENCTSGVPKLSVIEFKAWMNGNNLHLDFNMPLENVVLHIYDLSGREILNQSFETAPDFINLNGLQSGIYMIGVMSKDFSGVRKIFK